MKRFLPLIVFGVLCAVLALGLLVDTREVKSAYLDKQAPMFRLHDLLDPDKQISNADFTGKLVILNVWASWCSTCYVEHPVLISLARDKRFYIVGLNYKDSRINALAWLKKEGNPYRRVMQDFDGSTGIDFGVTGVPETFIIDPAGVIRFKVSGALTPKIVEEKIRPLARKLFRQPVKQQVR